MKADATIEMSIEVRNIRGACVCPKCGAEIDLTLKAIELPVVAAVPRLAPDTPGYETAPLW